MQGYFCHYEGCTFPVDEELFSNINFRNINDNIIIVIDWQHAVPEVPQSNSHPSYDECLTIAEGRFERLSDLLEQNFRMEEQIELTCEKEECKFKEAVRTEKIEVMPNILLVRLPPFSCTSNGLPTKTTCWSS